MKYLSIKEYFYKLNTIGFIVLLLPITTFFFLYFIASDDVPTLADPGVVKTLLIIASVLLLLDLTIVHWVCKVRIEKMKSFIELAKKMDGFYSLTVLRMGSYCGCALVMAVGLYLTYSQVFTGLFLLIFVVVILHWPTPSFFCKQFDLTKNEREMMLNGGDLIGKRK